MKDGENPAQRFPFTEAAAQLCSFSQTHGQLSRVRIAKHCSDKLAPAFTFCQKRSCAGSCAKYCELTAKTHVHANLCPC